MTKGPRGLAHQRVYTGPNLISPQTLKAYLHNRLLCPFHTTHSCIPIINEKDLRKHNKALIWVWLVLVCVCIFDVSNPVELRFSANSFSHFFRNPLKTRVRNQSLFHKCFRYLFHQLYAKKPIALGEFILKILV